MPLLWMVEEEGECNWEMDSYWRFHESTGGGILTPHPSLFPAHVFPSWVLLFLLFSHSVGGETRRGKENTFLGIRSTYAKYSQYLHPLSTRRKCSTKGTKVTLLLFPSSRGLPLTPTERQTEWPSTRTVSEKPHGGPEGRTFACLVLGPPATTTNNVDQ